MSTSDNENHNNYHLPCNCSSNLISLVVFFTFLPSDLSNILAIYCQQSSIRDSLASFSTFTSLAIFACSAFLSSTFTSLYLNSCLTLALHLLFTPIVMILLLFSIFLSVLFILYHHPIPLLHSDIMVISQLHYNIICPTMTPTYSMSLHNDSYLFHFTPQ